MIPVKVIKEGKEIHSFQLKEVKDCPGIGDSLLIERYEYRIHERVFDYKKDSWCECIKLKVLPF